LNQTSASDVLRALTLGLRVNPTTEAYPRNSESRTDFEEVEIDSLERIAQEVFDCQKCGLCLTRNAAVPGMGVREPLVLVVGEAPGADEDKQGLPFVGKAGAYLDEWLKALGFSRQDTVYITNLIKCRPPQNRDPHPDEIQQCSPYLDRQIALLKPRTILTVGRVPSAHFLGGAHRMEDIHGRVYEFRGIPVVPTYHPAAVLRNPDLRPVVWKDLKNLHTLLVVKGLAGPLPTRSTR